MPNEQQLINLLSIYPGRLQDAAKDYAPSIIANYAYDLAKEYNQFYQSIPIFAEADQSKLKLRVALSEKVADVLKKSIGLLGVEVPERM